MEDPACIEAKKGCPGRTEDFYRPETQSGGKYAIYGSTLAKDALGRGLPIADL